MSAACRAWGLLRGEPGVFRGHTRGCQAWQPGTAYPRVHARKTAACQRVRPASSRSQAATACSSRRASRRRAARAWLAVTEFVRGGRRRDRGGVPAGAKRPRRCRRRPWPSRRDSSALPNEDKNQLVLCARGRNRPDRRSGSAPDLGVRDRDPEALLERPRAPCPRGSRGPRPGARRRRSGRPRTWRARPRARRPARSRRCRRRRRCRPPPAARRSPPAAGFASAIASSGSETQKASFDWFVAGETTSTSAPSISSPRVARSRSASTGSGVRTSSFIVSVRTRPARCKRRSDRGRRR